MKRFDQFIIGIGFKHSSFYACVYMKNAGSSTIDFLLYVDDMLFAAKSMSDIANLKAQLNAEF